MEVRIRKYKNVINKNVPQMIDADRLISHLSSLAAPQDGVAERIAEFLEYIFCPSCDNQDEKAIWKYKCISSLHGGKNIKSVIGYCMQK